MRGKWNNPYVRNLQFLCEALNRWREKGAPQAAAEASKQISSWIEKWREYPNLESMLNDYEELRSDLPKAVKVAFGPIPNSRGADAFLLPSIAFPDEPDRSGATPHAHAVWAFHRLITSPVWDKFEGPCVRCGKYYVRRRPSQTKYCSRNCGARSAAEARMREKFAIEHTRKLNRARAAIRKCKLSSGSLEWKQWVADRADVTVKWVTRAMNKGEL